MCQEKGCVLYEMLIIVYEFQLISHHPPQRHKNHDAATSHTQYSAYQKHPCHRCGAPTNPSPIQDSSLLICSYGNHATTFHASRLHRKNQVIIILAVEVWHEALFIPINTKGMSRF